MPRKKKEEVETPKINIPTYTEEQIDNKEVDIGRASSEEVKTMRKEILETILTKKGSLCLLNDIVKHYNGGKSNSQLHTRLRNIFHKPYLGTRVVKKEERLFVERTKQEVK